MKTVTRFAAAMAAASLALAACSSDASDDDETTGGDDASNESTDNGGDDSTDNGDEGEDGADAGDAFDFNETPYDEVSDGGTFTTAITEIADQQNPFHADASLYTSQLWYWYNPQLARFTGDGEWSFNPNYFDDVTEDEVDGKTVVTYDVKDEAVFNDGTPIDYRAFEATWKANSGEDDAYDPSATDGYELIESVEPGDSDKQVVVTFNGIYAWWQGIFNDVLHPDAASADVYNEGFLRQVHPEWGAGPYKVENIDFNKGEATFVRNENWWGDEGKLDKRTFRVMESQASLNAFLNGEIDATAVGSEERLTAVKDMDGIEIRQGFSPSNALFMLNSDVETLADPDVREAVFTGIDRTILSSITFQGLDYEEPLPGSFVLFPVQEGYSDNFGEVIQYDPNKAMELLEGAGWTDEDGDGIREKDGETLTLNMPVLGDSATVKDRAAAMQNMLKAIGVDLQIEERPSSEFSQIYSNREFDVFNLGFSSSDPFGVAYFNQIYGSDSGLNLSGTGTEEFDEKIAELQQIPDRDEQIEAANELEVEAFKLYGIMPLFNGPDMVAVKDGLANYGAYGFAQLSTPVETIGWTE